MYTEKNIYSWYCQCILSWRMAAQPQINRVDHDLRTNIAALQVQEADGEIAQARIEHLEPLSRPWSSSVKQAVEGIISVIGALTFSTVPRLLFSASLGTTLATIGGFVIGGFLSWGLHHVATRFLGRLLRRHDSLHALAAIDHQHQNYPAHNELVEKYFAQQKMRVYSVEADNLKPTLWGDLRLLVGLITLESAVAIFLLWPTGWFIAILGGCFPAAVICLAAYFLSYKIDFAIACRSLIAAYEAFLPTGQVTEEEALEVFLMDKEFKQAISVTAPTIETEADREHWHKLWTQEFANKRIHELRQEWGNRRKALNQQLQQQIQALQEQYTVPGEAKAFVAEAKERYAEALQELGEDYAEKIGFWQEKLPPEQQEVAHDRVINLAERTQ